MPAEAPYPSGKQNISGVTEQYLFPLEFLLLLSYNNTRTAAFLFILVSLSSLCIAANGFHLNPSYGHIG